MLARSGHCTHRCLPAEDSLGILIGLEVCDRINVILSDFDTSEPHSWRMIELDRLLSLLITRMCIELLVHCL
jgi:hypothetical protein